MTEASRVSDTTQLVVFRLDERRYALPLAAVERVVRSVTVTPLPGAPAIVLGGINVHGRVLPVLNVRRRFRMPDRDTQSQESRGRVAKDD
jgi:purine-binding chemotaxis protein CheW